MANATSSKLTENRDQNFANKKDDNSLRSSLTEVVGKENIDAIREVATEARDKVTDLASQTKDRVKDYANNANEYVRRYPIQSILVGLGIGFVIGALISPRR